MISNPFICIGGLYFVLLRLNGSVISIMCPVLNGYMIQNICCLNPGSLIFMSLLNPGFFKRHRKSLRGAMCFVEITAIPISGS